MDWTLTIHNPFSSIYLFFHSQRATYIRFYYWNLLKTFFLLFLFSLSKLKNFLLQLDASNEDSLDLAPDNSSSSKVRLGHLIWLSNKIRYRIYRMILCWIWSIWFLYHSVSSDHLIYNTGVGKEKRSFRWNILISNDWTPW